MHFYLNTREKQSDLFLKALNYRLLLFKLFAGGRIEASGLADFVVRFLNLAQRQVRVLAENVVANSVKLAFPEFLQFASQFLHGQLRLKQVTHELLVLVPQLSVTICGLFVQVNENLLFSRFVDYWSLIPELKVSMHCI